MADTHVNALLQEMATEMAFLSPDSAQGLALIAAVLEQLQEQQAVTGSADAGRELALCQTLCQPAASGAGLSQPQLEQLQSAFERMSNALYLVKPTQEDPLALQLDSAGLSGQAQNAQDQVNQQAQDSEGTEGRFFIGADDDLELLNEFCNEGRDLLGQVEQGVLVLEENPRHKDTLNQVFRAFHTFKGGAGFLGIAPIQLLAHHLESLLDAARKDQLPINQAVIDVILAGGDALQKYVSAIARQLAGEDRGQAIFVDTSELLVRIEACLRGEPAPAASAATPPQVSDLPALPDLPDLPPAEPVAAPAVQPAAAAELLAQHKPPVVLASAAPPVAAPAPAPDKSAGAGKPAPAPAGQTSKVAARTEALANFVKLDTHKLDALVDLMGELVIAQSMVVQHSLVQQLRDRELDRHLRQLSRITTDLQRNAMSLRMVPIRSTFQKMNRLVRDLAAAQHKQVQLVLSGEDTELDRNIVEELADPLLHMMRNAVDHGIESPADRLAAGKSAQGTIELHATHQGGGILIRLRDDGRGLDTQRILSKALQKGLITAEDAPTDKSIFNLIFLPGFSTAEAVTDISGRGVGMDVVRGNIARLRGRIDITSALGQGTTFEIFLPLTLAIIDGMLVGVGPERFIVPTLTIRESLRPQPQMVSTVQGKGELIRVRDKLIPLVRLSDKLGLVSQVRDPCEGIVMVVDSGARSRALLVDSLIGKQEVVIKSLGQTFKHQQGMSGAAILGDGRVALIIDPEAVSQLGSANEMAA